jgi:nucleotide-binding universal stress UspA family protein
MKFKPANKKGSLLVELGPEEKPLVSLASSRAAAAVPVFNLNKILVPVDFSETSRKAVHYAVALAKLFAGEVSLLHVVRPYPFVPQMDPVDIASIQDAKRDLEALRGQVGELVRCSTLLRKGDPPLEIIGAAEEFEVDLIVIGTHGRSGLAHMVLGSTAEKVIQRAVCPVLVVREREHEFISASAFSVSKSEAATGPS